MILPCRIHGARNTALIRCPSRSCSFFAYLLLSAKRRVKRPWLPRRKRPGSAGCQLFQFKSRPAWTSATMTTLAGTSHGNGQGSQGSFFSRENLVLTYVRPTERTQVQFDWGRTFYPVFRSGTDDKDGNVTLSLTHNFSTRLSFYASVYAAYQTEPNFKSNIGPENVRARSFRHDRYFCGDLSMAPAI